MPGIPGKVVGGDRATHRGKSGPLVNFLQPTQNGGGRLMAAPKNPATHVARQAKKTKAQERAEHAGTIDELRRVVWAAIERVDAIVQDENADSALTLKGTHALVQAAGAYVKITDAGEFEARLSAIEKKLEKAPPKYSGAFA